MRRHHILIPLAALLVVLPLLTGGCSCGHDFEFHIQSWLDAAEQFRHGNLNPHWAFSAAFHAGEPRFIFYPPLSWTLGALLTMLLPAKLVTTIYTFLALTAAGFAMHRLASHFANANAALLITALYVANPYMLFTAFERTAYAELLAAAWLPLLFLAVLRERPTVRGVALPVALLWLTNAPAAVMGCYAMAVIVLMRLAHPFCLSSFAKAGSPASALGSLGCKRRISFPAGKQHTPHSGAAFSPLRLLLATTGGTILGLALAAFYLIPAAYERRFVQIAMAIIPNMRFQDNFLFGHTDDAPHNVVLHTASLLAVGLLLTTAASLTTLYLRNNVSSRLEAEGPGATGSADTRRIASIAAALTLAIAFLLTPLSTPLWNHIPELTFLQFPWRLLTVLTVVLALALTLLLRTARIGARLTVPLAFAVIAALTFPAIHAFRQGCEAADRPAARAQLFAQHRGVEPTDEYTPNSADNDILRADDPPYWLSPDPAAFASGTTPNPATLAPAADTSPARSDAAPASANSLVEGSEPFEFSFTAPTREFLILNLRDYPNWNVTRSGDDTLSIEGYPLVPRDDGLIAFEVPPGPSTVYIAWERSRDQWAGIAVSLAALLVYLPLTLLSRSRRIEA